MISRKMLSSIDTSKPSNSESVCPICNAGIKPEAKYTYPVWENGYIIGYISFRNPIENYHRKV